MKAETKPTKCTYPDCEKCEFDDDCHYFGSMVRKKRKPKGSRFDKYRRKIKKLILQGYTNEEIAEYLTSIGEKTRKRQIEMYILRHGLSFPKGERRLWVYERKRKHEQDN